MAAAPARITLDPVPESVARARQFVRGCALMRGELGDAALLLVSELVTNAVVHAATEVSVEVISDDDALRVRVHDRDGANVPVPTHPPLGSDHGRGLLLLSALASGWGFDADERGKVTWFELAY